ncbi:MAG: formylmethanofuran dehydrogenase subunit E family protein [Candidatus Bathyarchaeia archaeon]|jgi:formylmethanofuran dehydrogenase subunit E
MMKMKNPKQRMYTKELEETAVRLHGHGGPFMVVGLRMGLEALNILDARGWFDIKCEAELRWAPPDACVLDGIQVSTGCTLGKHNIEVKQGQGLSATFKHGDMGVTLKVRPSVLAKISGSLEEHDHDEENPEHEAETRQLMDELIAMPVSELFEIIRN